MLESGVDFHRRGEVKKAQSTFRKALKREPSNSQARYYYAVSLLDGGNLVGGTAQLRKLVAHEPTHADARYSLGRALGVAGEITQAIENLEIAVELNPKNPDAFVELGNCCLKNAQPARAVEVLRQGLETTSNNAQILNNLGNALVACSRFDEAISAFRRAVDGNRQSPRAHYNLANAQKAGGLLREAEASYGLALALDPAFLEARHNLATLSKELVKLDRAFEEFARAHQIRRSLSPRSVDDGVVGSANLEATFRTTSVGKLEHDIVQFRFLREAGVLNRDYDQTIENYEYVLSQVKRRCTVDRHIIALSTKQRAMIGDVYNRLVYTTDPAALTTSPLNPRLDIARTQADYARNAPGIVSIDNLLTDQALEALRRFCLESTIWYDFQHAGGYLGAYLEDGFCNQLLLQIAQELRTRFPEIFRHHQLRQMWAYKYDNRRRGIATHADFAAVNVNFWKGLSL